LPTYQLLQNQGMRYTPPALTNLRLMLVAVAAVPLVCALLAVVLVARQQFEQLAQTQSTLMQPLLLQARKDEIQHFVKLGRRAIEQIDANATNMAPAQREALGVLRRMDLGNDNYFFVYDLQGNNLMHPRLPELEGKNHWEMHDSSGSPIIQKLVKQAMAGGGFVDYMWHRPSTGREERKLGYVEVVPEFGWMIGTGLYVDHLKETQELVVQATSTALAKTRNQVLWIASAALLLVTAGGLLLNLHEQRSADKKLRVMAHRVVSSQEEERTRVSRELHDGVSQMLASAKFTLETALIQIEPTLPKVALPLKSCLTLLQRLMKDVSRISHNLRPSMLDDLDLGNAMTQLAREFTERTGVAADVQISALPMISEAVSTAIFRVTQEALSNIERHADAHHVHVQLRHDDAHIALLIRDDGRGFDLQDTLRPVRSGLGLINMRERIEMLSGRYVIESSASGTLVQADLPVVTIT
jgi:two-component system, NarL family, sensor kinase